MRRNFLKIISLSITWSLLLPFNFVSAVTKKLFNKDLTDEQKIYFAHLQDLQRKINTTQFNLDQLNVGMAKFKDMFIASVNAPDEKEEKDDD